MIENSAPRLRGNSLPDWPRTALQGGDQLSRAAGPPVSGCTIQDWPKDLDAAGGNAPSAGVSRLLPVAGLNATIDVCIQPALGSSNALRGSGRNAFVSRPTIAAVCRTECSTYIMHSSYDLQGFLQSPVAATCSGQEEEGQEQEGGGRTGVHSPEADQCCPVQAPAGSMRSSGGLTGSVVVHGWGCRV